jgi:hypothetical protein
VNESVKHKNPNKKSCGNRLKPIQKLAINALLKTGHTPTEISRLNGVNRVTVYNVMKDPRFALLPSNEVDGIKRTLIGKTLESAARAQIAISDEKLENSSALQLMTISAIGIDKSRLMSGDSTSNLLFGTVIQSIDNDRVKIMGAYDDDNNKT